MQSVDVKARRMGIINPFLPSVRSDEAPDRARSCARVLPLPMTARASRE
jgi:hypothetical protein